MERSYPQRTCIGCRQVKEKRDLIRLVHTADGAFHVDGSGKLNGRGAYVCPQAACIESAFKKGALAKSFRTSLTALDKERLLEELKEFGQENT